jgi:rhamnogalacturonan endolyase
MMPLCVAVSSNLTFTSASVVKTGTHNGVSYMDVMFSSGGGDMHWVIFSGLAGAYQYFVNRNLPTLGEFRSLWRLDNTTFPKAKTDLRDEALPPLSDYIAANNVQDETWLKPDGSGYITKYDFTTWIRSQTYYGLYGEGFGSWFINPGKDYFNGNHLKQELFVSQEPTTLSLCHSATLPLCLASAAWPSVYSYIHPPVAPLTEDHQKLHRESKTGDAVQLNMIHGTHFQVSAVDDFPAGKMWGPWLWYLVSKPIFRDHCLEFFMSTNGSLFFFAFCGQNDGSHSDVASRAAAEFAAWPYAWLEDEAYQSRGTVKGRLVLSDGRPAANAAVFLGDNKPTKTALDMGSDYYYTDYADENGYFEIKNVRKAAYGFQAWSNGGIIGDVSTSVLQNDVVVSQGQVTDLGTVSWAVSPRKKIFQIGEFDRQSKGFRFSDHLPTHGLSSGCPVDLTYRIGCSRPEDWCYVQTHRGNWTVSFRLKELPNPLPVSATLIVSLAGYSTGTSSTIWANNRVIGNLTSGTPGLLNDPSVYRSATAAGEWRYFEFPFDSNVLTVGENEVKFEVTRNSTWKGFMWDSVILEW